MYSSYNNSVTFSELRVGELFHTGVGIAYRKIDNFNARLATGPDSVKVQVVSKEVYHIPQH